MKQLIAFIFLYILGFPFVALAQQNPKIKTIVTRTDFTLDENSIIKNEQGNRIGKAEFYEAVESHDYAFKPVKDKQGKIIEFTMVPNSKIDTSKNKNRVSITTSDPRAFSGLLPGSSMPIFNTQNLTGEKILSESLKGKIVIFNFWLTRYAPCIETLPAWNKLFLKYEHNPNIVFLAPTGEKIDSVKAFMSEDSTGFFYSVIPDAKDLLTKFNIKSYPSNIIFDQNGKVFTSKSCWNNDLVNKLDIDIQKLLTKNNVTK